jgi:hypothetical protein
MKKISLSELQDGMILAQPLLGKSSSVLMGPGTPLRASMAPRLSVWGVEYLIVESTDEAMLPPPNEPHHTPVAEAQLMDMFQGRLVNEPMNILYRALLRFHGKHHDAP